MYEIGMPISDFFNVLKLNLRSPQSVVHGKTKHVATCSFIIEISTMVVID